MKKYFFSRFLIPIIALSFCYSCVAHRSPIISPEKSEELKRKVKHKMFGPSLSLGNDFDCHFGVGCYKNGTFVGGGQESAAEDMKGAPDD